MRNLRLLFLLISSCLMVIMSQSCKPDTPDSAEELPLNTTGQNNQEIDSTQMRLSVLVDGTSFSADTTSINYSYDDEFDMHVFTAPDNTGHIVSIMLSSLEEGTYEVDFDNAVIIYQSGTTVYNGGINPQGTLIISRNANSQISGSFHAELLDFNSGGELILTDGHFINLTF